jgi:hypothetical protein
MNLKLIAVALCYCLLVFLVTWIHYHEKTSR